MAKKKRKARSGSRRDKFSIGTWPTPEKPKRKGAAAAVRKKKKKTKKTKKTKKKSAKKRVRSTPQKR